MRTIGQIAVSSADRERLEELVEARSTAPKVAWRARIILLAGNGLPARAIAATTGKSDLTVRRWRRRYAAKGVDGLLKDEPRPGRPPLTAQKIKQVVEMTLHETPPNATHWTARTMAAAVGISHASVRRIWRTHKLAAPWVLPSVRMRTVVSSADRGRLEELVRARDTSQKVVWRARIILFAGDGLPARTIAAVVGKSELTVRRWRRRYAAKGVDGLRDAPFGRPPLTARKQVVDMTLNETPSNATHWTASSMAAATGISEASVRRFWRAHGLKPHIKTPKASRQP